MNFETCNSVEQTLVDANEILYLASRSEKCFLTANRGVYVFELLINGNEFLYTTHSKEDVDLICKTLQANGVAVLDGENAFHFVLVVIALGLFALCIIALLQNNFHI